MADKHNPNIPAISNQVAEDIPDIKENLEFHKDAFERVFKAWSDTDNSAAKYNPDVGFSDGTYNYEFPTNGVGAHSVFMLGTSDTIVWMYLNTAPPGWKALATGADMVLGISGGTEAYNVNGGNPDSEATWTQPTHVHQWYDFKSGSDDESYDSAGSGKSVLGTANADAGIEVAKTSSIKIDEDFYTNPKAPANTWRPSASVGKLFQLDTA